RPSIKDGGAGTESKGDYGKSTEWPDDVDALSARKTLTGSTSRTRVRQTGADVHYCTPRSCRAGDSFGNRLRDTSGLRLGVSRHDLGVFATQDIPEGTIIGENGGLLTLHDFAKEAQRTSDYALQLQDRTQTAETVFIDARKCGGMARFINHSCDPDCHFFQVENRKNRRVIVLAVRDICGGSEITVDYGQLWFERECDAGKCRGGGRYRRRLV
ncbi:hypothetical protein PybrP1_001200, partial [[Pythium] brassicae (nom. inval.)]